MTARPALLAAPLAGLCLTLAGCGGGAANNASAGPPPLDTVQNNMLALSDPLRNGVLIRAIVDAREQCSHVERSESLGVVNGLPTFVAYCDTNRAFTVQIRAGGSASVTRGVPAR